MALNQVGTLNATQMAAYMRRVQLPYLKKAFPLRSVLLQRLGTRTKNVAEGEQVSWPIWTHGGAGYVWSRAGKLATHSAPGVKRAFFNYASQNMRFKIDEQFLSRTGGGPPSAEGNPQEFGRRNMIRQARRDTNFDLYGDGTGVLTALTNVTTATATQFSVENVRGVRTGMFVDVLLIADGSVQVSDTEIAVDQKNKIVTLTTSGKSLASFADVNANPTAYAVYRHLSRNDAINGLGSIISESNPPTGVNYGGLDRAVSTNDFWKATVKDDGPQSIQNLEIIDELITDILVRTDESPTVGLLHPKLMIGLKARLNQDKRFQGKEMIFNGWAKGVNYAGLDFIEDTQCPEDRLYLLFEDEDVWFFSQDADWRFMEMDQIEDELAHQMKAFRRWELVCLYPAAQGVLLNLTAAA